EDSGQEGLERELDAYLRGKSVQVQATRDARGTMVLEQGAPDLSDLTGATVTLTLDTAIQLAAEKELAVAVKSAGAVGGWALVLDVNTGAVLALAGNPVCAAKIGEKLGKQKLIEGLRAFGFGEKTALGLPGEARGALADPRRMPPIAVNTIAFGQGMSATGIQTVAAMAAIANGGVLLRPYLVQSVIGSDGAVLLSRGREEVRRVLSEETARQVTAMLEEVVQKGTGTRAALVGPRVAGT